MMLRSSRKVLVSNPIARSNRERHATSGFHPLSRLRFFSIPLCRLGSTEWEADKNWLACSSLTRPAHPCVDAADVSPAP
jgi:hypothetical protein